MSLLDDIFQEATKGLSCKYKLVENFDSEKTWTVQCDIGDGRIGLANVSGYFMGGCLTKSKDMNALRVQLIADMKWCCNMARKNAI